MKLYWRLKKKGKWTWRPAQVQADVSYDEYDRARWYLIEEEE